MINGPHYLCHPIICKLSSLKKELLQHSSISLAAYRFFCWSKVVTNNWSSILTDHMPQNNPCEKSSGIPQHLHRASFLFPREYTFINHNWNHVMVTLSPESSDTVIDQAINLYSCSFWSDMKLLISCRLDYPPRPCSSNATDIPTVHVILSIGKDFPDS